MKLKTYLLLIFALLSPSLVYVFISDINTLIKYTPDDVYYGLVPAYNLIKLGIPTFDGVNPTNGFHPLHFLVFVLFALSQSKIWMVKLAFLETILWIILAAVVVDKYRLSKKNISQRSRIIYITILSLPAWVPFILVDVGMEMALTYFFCVLSFQTWFSCYENNFQSHKQNMLLALFLSLLVLSRLDSFFIFIPCGLLTFIFLFLKKNTYKKFMLPLFIAIVPLGAYLLINYIAFDIFIPISGIVKRELAHNSLHNFYALIGSYKPIGYFSIIMPIIAGIATFFSVRNKKLKVFTFLIFCGIFIQYYYMLFHGRHIFRWYLATIIAAQTVYIGLIIEHFIQHISIKHLINKRMSVLAAITIHILIYIFFFWAISNSNFSSYQLKKVAAQLNQDLQPTDVVMAMDAGIFGTFCHARIVNIEGLANSPDNYFKYLKNPPQLVEYFKVEKATHFLVRSAIVFQSKEDKNKVYCYRDQRLLMNKSDLINQYDAWGQKNGLSLYRLTK